MERAAFLIEATQERVTCLLNPEHVTVQRTAGIRQRATLSGQLGGRYLSDDPLLYTGGGSTQLTMSLLFDVTLLGSSFMTDDVRNLTQPLWNLSENQTQRTSAPAYVQPYHVRFIWGKVWSFPGVIAAISERLEDFTSQGIPRRSWLRLRMLRIDEGASAIRTPPLSEPLTAVAQPVLLQRDAVVHEVMGSGGDTERLDEIAAHYYGNPALWRVIANANEIRDPLNLTPGLRLTIPPIGKQS